MLLNYLKIAFRSIIHSKLTTFINIAGLSLSMLCGLLIYVYIQDEVDYDRYHKNADKIYRVTRNFLSHDGSVSLHLGHVAPPFGPLLKNDFSQMEEVARVLNTSLLLTLEENGERKFNFNEDRCYMAEPAIFKIFSIDVLDGNVSTALQQPFTIMLSDKMALKYFGTLHIQGKRLRADNQFDLTVSGVFKSFPDQSHWHPDFLISFTTLFDETIYGRKNLDTNWGNNSFSTYVLGNEQFDPETLALQFPAFLNRHMGSQAATSNDPLPSTWTTLFLQPLTDIHLHSHLDSEVETNGSGNTVYMLTLIGIFIMLIACFNFINLSTAQATKRAKEVALRKVVGAFKNQLIFQYLCEAVLTSIVAMCLALLIMPVVLPWLNDFTQKSLSLNPFTHASNLIVIVGGTLLAGVLAGLYPAFVLSDFKPALMLKGKGAAPGRGSIRKGLVVVQFAISIVLVIGTSIIFLQLRYLNTQDLGYAKDQLINLPYYGDDLANKYEAFYTELNRSASIKNVTRSSIIPTGRLLDSQGSQVEKEDSMVSTAIVIKNVRIDPEFFNTYAVKVISGRNFSKAIKSDDSLAFVINESAANMIGWTNEEAIGKVFKNGDVKGQVIGVVQDFHFESLHEKIMPIVFQGQPNFRRLSVRLGGGDFHAGIQQLEKVWNEFLPQRPFEYTFLAERYKALYKSEETQSQLFLIFSGLAIFISSLGLFGLVTFSTLQRTKEIGIRKVLGASITSLVTLLSKEIIVLLVLANVVAWPVAWYFSSQWLDSFAYRIEGNVLVYLAASLIALVIGLLTVSSQTIKASLTNPTTTLRSD